MGKIRGNRKFIKTYQQSQLLGSINGVSSEVTKKAAKEDNRGSEGAVVPGKPRFS